ncbi:hypothetical protein [Humibacillus xanthopallidus]|uniref:Uncharacterized protein n=1 Tax=Humibacillus xanthopallidus TaxID=412689 RepID=A0A543HUC2_9MICO|nr:hypothetical protein [Humibacillus xanthopallidus]TQM61956.1 hypothetical protein FBY41_1978 [Humibacillus xanthopallidus]
MADLASGDLEDVVVALLVNASAELFGGSPPAVAVSVSRESVTLRNSPPHGPVGVRRESHAESLTFDPEHLEGPYRLQTPPAPGGRVVRVLIDDAIAFTLRDEEVSWTPNDLTEFTLSPRPHRSFAGATSVRVDFGLDAVTVMLLGTGKAVISLTGPPALVERAANLALAVLTLETDQLLALVTTSGDEGDYTTRRRLTELAVVEIELASVTDSATVAVARMTLELATTFEVRRALREGEGTPIIRVASPGAPGASAVAVEAQVEA